MKTDELIALLATDTRPGRPVWPDVLFAMLGPLLVVGAILVAVLGIRPDLISASLDPVVIWKWIIPGLLFAAGLSLALSLSRPDSMPHGAWWVVALAAGCAAALFASRLIVLPSTEWISAIRGQSISACLISVTSVGLAGLIGGLAILQRGASTRPGLSGFVLGLGTGGAAAFLYALHCNEDDPMFYITWYGAGILIVGLIGAALGQRFLKI